MAKITLVPTSHIAKESLERVKNAVDKEKPDCIAVELDINRYFAMQKEQEDGRGALRMLGPSTWLIYFLFKKLQGWMGKKVSIFPGEEMMEAVRLAGRRKIKVAFIDQDVRLTFLNMKTVSVKEKMKLIWFLLKGLTLGYAWSKIRRQEGIDLSKVPSEELVEEAMGLLRKDFPQIYRVLVTDRDAFMAKNLSGLSGKFKSIVAVVGAGHQKGISSFLGQKKAP